MSGQLTALVVLRTTGPGDLEPPPGATERVVRAFRELGFETGPPVGISFAVTAGAERFARVLGEPGADGAFALDALPAAAREDVAAVTLTAPPDFGPRNP